MLVGIRRAPFHHDDLFIQLVVFLMLLRSRSCYAMEIATLDAMMRPVQCTSGPCPMRQRDDAPASLPADDPATGG